MRMFSDNSDMAVAWKLLTETNKNVFLTGRAGTGKTTFLKYFRENYISQSGKNAVTVAPTGVAAINADGVTIHSFFQLPFSPYIPNDSELPSGASRMRYNKRELLRQLDLLIIDEVSMVRADLLDLIDAVLRYYRHSSEPFGGVQLLLIGDLHQLAPVVTSAEEEILSNYYSSFFFFESKALKRVGYTTIILNKVYRQTDQRFLNILEEVRTCSLTEENLKLLNQRFRANFNLYEENNSVRLMTHIKQVETINTQFLQNINAPESLFKCVVSGKFPESAYPNDEILHMKKGARVMFVKNDDSYDRLFYNGLLGVVEKINVKDNTIVVRADNNEQICVGYMSWEHITYTYDSINKEVKENVEGTFSQLPVRLAWAITIHKSQGLTFDNVIIDVSHSFTFGQTYVALSRCKTLEGITLLRPIGLSNIHKNKLIDDYDTFSNNNQPQNKDIQTWKISCIEKKYDQIFDYHALESCYYKITAKITPTLFDKKEKELKLWSRFYAVMFSRNEYSFRDIYEQYIQLKRKYLTYNVEELNDCLDNITSYLLPQFSITFENIGE
ncbi:MAG: PIF1 family DEAD/DEAH box helicase, partial [Bacteroidales bacterium]|nr:PIF1 family DEAD/DEAH box helicase [Bacteroidales bacterium]